MNRTSLFFGALCLVALGFIGWSIARSGHSSNPSQLKHGAAVDMVPDTGGVRRLQSQKSRDSQAAPVSTVFPERLKFFLERPLEMPTADLLNQLQSSDQPHLIELYRSKTNLLERAPLIHVLAWVGNDEVVNLFQHSLSLEFAGRKLSSGDRGEPDEEMVLFNTVSALGLLAARSDAAYAFLKAGTDPWFWKGSVQWTSDRGRETVGLLTSFSIQAVGRSGRPDARTFLMAMRDRDLVNRTGESDRGAREFSGDIVTAVFLLDTIELKGPDYFRMQISSDLHAHMQAYIEWGATERGKAWRDWAKEARKRR